MIETFADREALRERLSQVVNEKRRSHSLAVAKTAVALAQHWGVDEYKAYVAGLLHDVARGMSGEELLTAALVYGVTVDEATLAQPILLHGPVGAAQLAEDWGIEDAEILEAVRLHTVPDPAMGDLAKIVFLADMLEPTRRSWPGQEELRRLAEEDLDAAMVRALEETLSYLEQRNIKPHPGSILILNQFREKLNHGKCGG